MATNIEWTHPPGYAGDTWNPTTGCSKVSDGCKNCYAMNMAYRLTNIASTKDAYNGTVKKLANGEINWTGKINMLPDRLEIPLRRKKPTAWFVNSMSDLFHEEIPFDFIDKVFAVMALCPHHIFQILTKRPDRMHEYMLGYGIVGGITGRSWRIREAGHAMNVPIRDDVNFALELHNVWLGVSVEDQKTADERIPILLNMPAAIHWISAEPILGVINLNRLDVGTGDTKLNGLLGALPAWDKLDWVVIGGESGKGAREFPLSIAMQIILQCKQSDTPIFMKQCGSRPTYFGKRIFLSDKKGGAPNEWLEELKVREFPEVAL